MIDHKKRRKSASKPLHTAREIAAPPILNSIFFSWGRVGPRFLRQTRTYGARERPSVSPVFRALITFRQLAPSLDLATTDGEDTTRKSSGELIMRRVGQGSHIFCCFSLEPVAMSAALSTTSVSIRRNSDTVTHVTSCRDS